MKHASPNLIRKIKQSKKWRLALIFAFLTILIALLALFKSHYKSGKDPRMQELNIAIQRNAESSKYSLIDLGSNDSLTANEQKQLLTQSDDQYISHDLCLANSIKFSFPYLYITTYSNLRQYECNSEAFYMMNLASLKAQLEIVDRPNKVSRMGPMNYAMTKNLSYSEQPYIHIGVQKFTQASRIRLSLFDVIKNPAIVSGEDITKAISFYPLHTEESISLYWAPDENAHALVDPVGTVYLLTSYNKRLLHQLNRNNLSVLQELITLPAGWKFVTEKITKPIYINHRSESGFTNIRLVDNLGNIYIKLVQN